MEKKEVLDLLLDYHNGHLNEELSRQLENKLKEDSELQAQYNLVQRELMLIRGGKGDQFEEARFTQISEKVMKQIREARKQSFARFSPVARSYLGASLIVLIIIVVLIFFFVFRPKNAQDTDVDQKPEIVTEEVVKQPPGREE